MSKRARRRRPPGRKVYYPRWSHQTASHALPRKEALSLLNGKARMESDDSRRAKEMRDQASEDRLFRALHIKRSGNLNAEEFDNEGDRKLAVELRRQELISKGERDHFIVIHQGLRHVRLMFYTADYHKWWIVERDLFRNTLRKSMVYGSRDQAMTASGLDYIQWIEYTD